MGIKYLITYHPISLTYLHVSPAQCNVCQVNDSYETVKPCLTEELKIDTLSINSCAFATSEFYLEHSAFALTHWGRVTHICVSKLTIIGSDNGLSPGRRQAIIWTNAAILSIGPLGTNFSEILIEIPIFSFKKSNLNMSVKNLAAILSRPQCVKWIAQDVLDDMARSHYRSLG